MMLFSMEKKGSDGYQLFVNFSMKIEKSEDCPPPSDFLYLRMNIQMHCLANLML